MCHVTKHAKTSGVARKFLQGSKSRRSGEWKYPSGVQGQSPGRGLGMTKPLHSQQLSIRITVKIYTQITPLCQGRIQEFAKGGGTPLPLSHTLLPLLPSRISAP